MVLKHCNHRCIMLLWKMVFAYCFIFPLKSLPIRTERFQMIQCGMELEKLTIPPIKSFQGILELPGSKSLSNRILLLSAFCKGKTKISNILDSEDIHHMINALKQLQVNLEVDWTNKTVKIEGNGGPFMKDREEFFLGNAGTAMRPLTAALCAGQGHYLLDGIPRMRERPILDLVHALQQMGVHITCSPTGCPPVTIDAHGLSGGHIRLSGKISSQYLTALLLVAPLATAPITIEIIDELLSAPYVHMTIALMKKYGISVECTHCPNTGHLLFSTMPGTYSSPGSILVEGDASSASYFAAGAMITGSSLSIHGLPQQSIQGDLRFLQVLQQMGATIHYAQDDSSVIQISRSPNSTILAIDEDCADIPDVAMTLAIVAIFARGTSRLRNIASWRVKETERMQAMVTEMRKVGVQVEEGWDYLIIHGLDGVKNASSKLRSNTVIDTYEDHRMAMCFSLIACGGVPVTIRNPACTKKTFPTYFDTLQRLTISADDDAKRI